MDAAIALLNRLSDAWAVQVLHLTWQSALLVALALVVARLGRRWPSPVRYGLLVVVLLKFAMPPTVGVTGGVFTSFGPEVIAQESTTETEPVSERTGSVTPMSSTAKHTPDEAGRGPTSDAGSETGGLTLLSALLAVHLLGVVACLLCTARAAWGVHALLRRSRPVSAGPLAEAFAQTCRDLGLRRNPELVLSPDVRGPLACGLVRRKVMLPAAMSDCPSEAIRPILAHELAHHRRLDLWVSWLQALLVAAWWFNPAIWLLNRRIRAVREECCDDVVLARAVATEEDYCDVLLQSAARASVSMSLVAALDGSRPLARRFLRIMDDTVPAQEKLSKGGVGVLVLAGLTLLPGLHSPGALPTVSRMPPHGALPDGLSSPDGEMLEVLSLLDEELTALRGEASRLRKLTSHLPEDDAMVRRARALEASVRTLERRRQSVRRLLTTTGRTYPSRRDGK